MRSNTTTNTGGICDACAGNRLKSWQEHHTHLIIHRGDYVKIRVSSTHGDGEWMWVEVFSAHALSDHELQLTGELRNDAVFIPEMTYGVPLTFLRTDIADYCSQGDFDHWHPWVDKENKHSDHAQPVN